MIKTAFAPVGASDGVRVVFQRTIADRPLATGARCDQVRLGAPGAVLRRHDETADPPTAVDPSSIRHRRAGTSTVQRA
jgi:hypothetical protein